MGDDIERRLAAAAAELHRHQTLTARADELLARRAAIDAEITKLLAEQAGEDRDVERLEGLSLTRILASLRGARDDRLARERAEADAAAYRIAEAQARLDAVTAEHETAVAELATLTSAQQTYDAVLDEKAKYLTDTQDPRGRRLLALAQEQGRLTEEARELAEATAAAHTARAALADLAQTLRSASAWSTYDTFFGGGAVSSLVKHARLDAAARQAAHADRCLVVLRTELADVDAMSHVDGSVAVDGLTRFVDVWFDNIFTDFAVRERIRHATENVARCTQRVVALLADLARRADVTRRRLDSIDAARAELLTSG
jgi:hypothetical protein